MEGRREGGGQKEITRGPYLDRDQLEDKHFLFEALRKVVGWNVLSAWRHFCPSDGWSDGQVSSKSRLLLHPIHQKSRQPMGRNEFPPGGMRQRGLASLLIFFARWRPRVFLQHEGGVVLALAMWRLHQAPLSVHLTSWEERRRQDEIVMRR